MRTIISACWAKAAPASKSVVRAAKIDDDEGDEEMVDASGDEGSDGPRKTSRAGSVSRATAVSAAHVILVTTAAR